jgi:hypothetical protein
MFHLVFGATVKFPSISILNGPFVTGVTSVLAAVACIPLTVSFLLHYPCCWEKIIGVVIIDNYRYCSCGAFAGVIPVDKFHKQ